MLEDDFLPLLIPTDVSSEEQEKWQKLNEQINIGVYNFLQNFRPSKTFRFEKEQIIGLGNIITNAISDLLKENNINVNKNVNSSYNSITDSYSINSTFDKNDMIDSNIDNKENYIDSYTSKLIHLLVTDKCKINQLNLSEEDRKKLLNDINWTLEKLVKDKTGLLSESYFKLYLAPKLSNSKRPIAATFISTNGIKLSNLAFSHTITDERLRKMNDVVLQELEDKKINYNCTPFIESENDTFVLSHGAGNYLFLYPANESAQMKEKIDKIVNDINNRVSKDENSQLFKIACYSSGNDNAYSSDSNISIIDYVKSIKEYADFKKDVLKKDLFKSKDAYIALYKSLNETFNYYLNNIPEASTDIKNIRTFVKNIYTAFLNQEVLHNQTKERKKRGCHIGCIDNSELER